MALNMIVESLITNLASITWSDNPPEWSVESVESSITWSEENLSDDQLPGLISTDQNPDQSHLATLTWSNQNPCLAWSEPLPGVITMLVWSPSYTNVIRNLTSFVWSSSCTIVIRNFAFLTLLISGHSQLSDPETLHHVINTRTTEDAVLLLWSYLDYHAVLFQLCDIIKINSSLPMYDDDKVSTHIS